MIKGYNIIYIPNNKQITSIHAYIKTGSIIETRKESGISHLTEHIISDAWKNCTYNCSEFWNKKGVLSNAHTFPSYVKYYIVGLDKYIEDMINYISGILTDPDFNKDLDKYYQSVKDELLMKMNKGDWKLDNSVYESLKDNFNNGINYIGDYEYQLKNLKKLKKKDIVDYYEKWYRPDNIVIFIVSGIPISKINNYFNKYLKDRPKLDTIPVNINLKIINHDKKIKRKNAKKFTLLYNFVCNNPSEDVFIYSGIIKDILTGDLYSYLYSDLRIDKKLIYGIRLDYEVNKSYIISSFMTNCQFVNKDKIINELKKALNKFLQGDFNDDLINRSKERYIINDLNSNKTSTEFLSAFYANQYLLFNRTDITPDSYLNLLKNVSKDKLVSVAKELFKLEFIITESN